MKKINFEKCEEKLLETRKTKITGNIHFVFPVALTASIGLLVLFMLLLILQIIFSFNIERVFYTILFLISGIMFFWASLYIYIYVFLEKKEKQKRKKIIKFWYFWTFKYISKKKKLYLINHES